MVKQRERSKEPCCDSDPEPYCRENLDLTCETLKTKGELKPRADATQPKPSNTKVK